MRRFGIVAVLVAVVSCSNVVLGEVSTTTSTSQPITTTTIPANTTTTIRPRPVGGHLVKLDLESLNPVADLEPIPMGVNSWTLTSEDGEWMLILEYVGETLREMISVDVTEWEVTGTFAGFRHSARVFDDDHLYMYDHVSGGISSLDLRNGQHTRLGEWPTGVWMWDELHVLPGGRLSGLASDGSGPGPAEYRLMWFDLASGDSGEIGVGPIERLDTETGVFDGDYQIPQSDSPGVVWGDDRVFIVHADVPEVTVVDLVSGEVLVHAIDLTTWFDRLLAFWLPTAVAKGPSLGTYSSAALSPDGRYLYVSGNRYEVAEGADGGLVEESTHLGLTVVDTETWQVVDQPDLPFQFVRESNGVIVGVDTRSTAPWIDDVYTLSIDDTGVVAYEGPFTVEGGGCLPMTGGSHLVCSDYVDANQGLSVVDMGTGDVIVELVIGQNDYLEENGVLQDWAPFLGSS